MDPKWLEWSIKLQSLAQSGLAYTNNIYDIERYEALREIAAEIMAGHVAEDKEEIVNIFTREDGYATPKVDVRGCVFRDDKILLVQESSDGKWSIPGGWADVCEAPSACAIREVWEESGFEVVARRLAAIYDRSSHPHEPPFPFHMYKLFFLCDITGGQARTSHETLAVDFFAEDALPELSISKNLPEQIAKMFDYYRNPDMIAYFD